MDIFKLFGEIVVNNENASKNIKEVTRLAEEARDKISKGFGNIGKAATTMGKIVGGALVGSGAIGGALVALTNDTMEYRTAMGKLEAAFTTSGHSAEVAKGTYSGLVSVLGDSDVAVEAANHLAKLTTNQQELQTWTNICTGVFATFGDSLPIEGLTEAANETAKVGQVTGPLADALNWAGVSEDKFNESLARCTTEQERQRLIMDTLNGIYDEASQKYQTINGDVIAANAAQEKYTEAMAMFGEKAQPIVNAVKDGLANLLLAATKLVENMDFTAIEETIDSAFSWMIDTVIPAVEGFFNFIVENKDAVLAAIAAVATGFLAWNVVSIVQGVISAIKAWKLATEGMTLAQKLLNLAMNANPIGVVITLISGLVAAFIYLWNNCEGFRNFFVNMWENIKDTAKKSIEKIKSFFDFNWELPKIKLPHFKISGEFSLNPPSIPKFGVEWYKKAYDKAMVLNDPTIFGFSPASGKMLGGGDGNGNEVIAGEAHLMNMIQEAVAAQNEALAYYLQTLVDMLADYFPQVIASAGHDIVTNDGVIVARYAPMFNTALGKISKGKDRGR